VWLSGLDPKRSLVVVLSDAGAARGNMDRHRIRETGEFLRRLRLRCRRVAWLNPLPSVRWAGTSAGQIAESVPMFSVQGKGIDQAVDYLRGKVGAPISKSVSPTT
ncbi:MAG: VWA domain-containing protein, partial [Bacteroidia bacterium]